MAAALYSLHSAALNTLFADVEASAIAQDGVFTGTAGSLLKRRNASQFEFYSHQFYDAAGVKRERYVAGPVGTAEADAAAESLRMRIEEVNRLTRSIRLLGREGFQLADSRTFATLAALQNHGLFGAGAVLIGSHAYGVLLNRLGIRAASYVTEDVDVARGAPLSLGLRKKKQLPEILSESGIDFIEVPRLDVRKPSTAFKERGRSSFQVELLSPARGEDEGSAPVPELGAQATTLPYLGYLIGESQMSAILAREGASAVRVPTPERFAIHKLVVSVLRRGRDAKIQKDRIQAIILSAALAEHHPGALPAAIAELPRRAAKHLARALDQVRGRMETASPRAWEELTSAV
jgi:hypothetical protein